jgi:MinD-like ATPase involved in chromosome partitioning or flagellar assembly
VTGTSADEPEIALVFSPEPWVEGLHRHFADHGGARIRQVVMDQRLALDEEYGVLVVSHRWPALTRGFIDAVHERHRAILGVYDPEEPTARAFLADLGVDGVIANDSSPGEFLTVILTLLPAVRRRLPEAMEAGTSGPGVTATGGDLVVVGGPAGGGNTEIAIELARRSGSASDDVVLVDADDVAPSIAQRLGLPIEPNLRTAIDAVEFGMGDLDGSLLAGPSPGLAVLAGLPNVGAWEQLRPAELADVLTALARRRTGLVVNIASRIENVPGAGRARYAIGRTLLAEADAIVAVTTGTPVGVTRLLAWVSEAQILGPTAPVHVVVNRAPTDGFTRAEITAEIVRTYPPASLSFVPDDERVAAASWLGTGVADGPFTRAVDALLAEIHPRRTDRHATRNPWRALPRSRLVRRLVRTRVGTR